MVPYLPKQIALRALVTYLIALAAVSLLFFSYVMSGWQIALGIIWVAAFFFLTNAITKTAPEKPESVFVRNLILIAFLLRIAWVLGSFFYYSDITGRPFSREAADELGYHEDAAWMAGVSWKLAFSYLQNFKSVSDWGFPLYLTLLYKVFGSGILFPRVMNAFFSTLSCLLAYRLSERTFGKETGLMTGTMRGFDRLILNPYLKNPANIGVRRTIDHLSAFSECDNYVFLHVSDPHPFCNNVPTSLPTQTKVPWQDMSFKHVQGEAALYLNSMAFLTQDNLYNIRRMDDELGMLLHFIEEHYDEDEYVVNVFSDHGVSIYEKEE